MVVKFHFPGPEENTSWGGWGTWKLNFRIFQSGDFYNFLGSVGRVYIEPETLVKVEECLLDTVHGRSPGDTFLRILVDVCRNWKPPMKEDELK